MTYGEQIWSTAADTRIVQIGVFDIAGEDSTQQEMLDSNAPGRYQIPCQ